MLRSILATGFMALLGASALAQQTETPNKPAAETAPQSSATTTVKAPAGVTHTNDAEMKATSDTTGKTNCKTASAEMTNGATESCK